MDKKFLQHAAAMQKQNPCYANKAVTRRTLLSQGILAGASWLAMPGILSMIMNKRAYGLVDPAVCAPADGGANPIPFLQFELSGGWASGANFAFGKQKGGAFEPLAAGSYTSLSIAPTAEPGVVAPNTSLVGPMHANSAFLAGMLSKMSQATIDKTAIAGGAGVSDDDSRGNPLNGAQLATMVSGAAPELVQLVGNTTGQNQNTFGRTASMTVGDGASISRAAVESADGLAGLVDPGLLAERLSPAAAESIAKAARMMSASQLDVFNAQTLSDQVRTLVECGYIGSSELLVFDAATLNPATDIAVTGVTGINLNDQQQAQTATIAKLLADGNAAAGTIEMGGYDYHGRGAQSQINDDFRAGEQVGIALEIASNKGRPMFITVTSDGSVASNGGGEINGRLAATSDSGARGAYLMIAMTDTAGTKPTFSTGGTQVGSYSDAGAVDTSDLVTANSPNLQALNIIANYASFNGTMDMFETQLGAAGVQNPFGGADKDRYIIFNPKG